MIVAALEDENDGWLGDWYFEALPRIGEHIVIPSERYEVRDVEHWPSLQSDLRPNPNLRIRVRLVGPIL